MPDTERMIQALQDNTEVVERLNKTMAATLAAISKHTDLQVPSAEPEVEPELVQDMVIKVIKLFKAESVDGVLRTAVPTLIREPRNRDAVELAIDGMLDEHYLKYEDGMLYRGPDHA